VDDPKLVRVLERRRDLAKPHLDFTQISRAVFFKDVAQGFSFDKLKNQKKLVRPKYNVINGRNVRM
jgi:hypothetical protein